VPAGTGLAAIRSTRVADVRTLEKVKEAPARVAEPAAVSRPAADQPAAGEPAS